MSLKIRLFGKKYPLFPFSFVSLGVIILILLGNWQIKRLGEKRELIDSIELAKITPPRTVTSQEINDVNLFQKVKLTGRFEQGQNIFLYGKRSGTAEKDGYYIMTPFIMDGGEEVVLVSRGWAPQTLKTRIDYNEVSLPYSPQTIEAIVMPGERKQYFMPENDTEKNIWFVIDPVLASKTHHVTVEHVYFRQINAADLPEGMVPLNTSSLSKIRNDHLEYAVTWYCLALALIVMFFVYYHNKEKSD